MKTLKRVEGLRSQAFLARSALAFVASLLAVTLTLTSSPLGASAGPLQASGSPSPGGTAPVIQILNPHPSYDPDLGNPPRMGADPPKISDRFDGVDNAYHIVALAANAPVDAIVEASYVVGSNNEVTIGQMSKVAGPTGTYELFWEIPDSLSDGSITIRVRMFQQTGSGFVELTKDEAVADLEHQEADPVAEDPFPADETIEITHPANAAALGFYKGSGGIWRTLLRGTASGATSEMDAFYSVAPAGREPVFKQCGHETLFDKPQYHFGIGEDMSLEEPIPFEVPCALEAADLGSAVTAVAMVAEEADKPDRGDAVNDPQQELSQDSADVHTVLPYIQDDLSISVTGDPGTSTPPDSRRVAGGNSCLAFLVTVVDQFQVSVEGANVDVHIQGPSDAVQFGNEANPAGGQTSGAHKTADKGAHSTENAKNCDGNGSSGQQGDHNVPGGNDIKHREASSGTGIAGGGNNVVPGGWRFHVWSTVRGFTAITAWVDDEPLPSPTEKRAADDDVLEASEPSSTYRAQWYQSAAIGEFIPLGDAGPAGTCRKFLFKARAGIDPIPQTNVDIHATGPSDALDFCDPGGGSARTAPDAGPHDAEAPGQSADKATSPTTHHTEGLTDDEGNFTFGIVSTAVGDTRLLGWMDGEQPRDDDVLVSGEPSSSATMTWASSSGDANVNFVNPSLYGGNTRAKVAKQTDANALYHIVTRVDAPSLIQGVLIQIGTGTGADFEKIKDIGTATQVAGTDTYELSWAVDVDDDDYTLRAQIVGTSVVTDIPITVNNEAGMVDPSDVPDTTLELTKPLAGQTVSFLRRSTPVDGIASSGTEGVDVFYTKAGANVPLASADWILCGFIQLNGTGNAPQPFQTTCQLQGSDQATQVTGIAAVTFDCAEPLPGAGCDAGPDDFPAGGRNPGDIDSGDAHRVFGFDANPLVGLTPPENENATGTCAKFIVQVTDETGQALPGQNVDVHLAGPGDSPRFCNPGDGTATPRRAPDQGGHSAVTGEQGAHVAEGADTHHAEGETTSEGRFIFGIVADASGDSALSAWLDRTDDDVQGGDEPIDSSLMHWVSATNCTQVGTARGDVLTGTPDADRICSRGGDDVIRGKGGNDVLLSGRGNDVVRGGGGSDSINASRGKDRLFGNSGNDTLKGAAGRDRLNGGGGSDSCDGGPERDRVTKCESGNRAPSPRMVRGGVA